MSDDLSRRSFFWRIDEPARRESAIKYLLIRQTTRPHGCRNQKVLPPIVRGRDPHDVAKKNISFRHAISARRYQRLPASTRRSCRARCLSSCGPPSGDSERLVRFWAVMGSVSFFVYALRITAQPRSVRFLGSTFCTLCAGCTPGQQSTLCVAATTCPRLPTIGACFRLTLSRERIGQTNWISVGNRGIVGKSMVSLGN